jgi:hypothetical protein
MAQVNAVFTHRKLLGMVEMDVSVMLLDPHLNQMPWDQEVIIG